MRTITVHFAEDPGSEAYADLANAIWMMLRTTGHEFEIEPDERCDHEQLDKAWDNYGEVSWKSGARRGTDQFVRAAGATARDAVLEVVAGLSSRSSDGTFTVQQVVDEFRRRGSAYKESTIRTHVTSRMCANAPDHHGTVYKDLVRVGNGRYRLA